MINEEIVLSKLNNNRFLGKSSLHFDKMPRRRVYYWDDVSYTRYEKDFDNYISYLKNIRGVKARVEEISKAKYNTYDERNKFQCASCTRRSTVDIWRIYRYYFGEVDIFTIMRALYQLVINDDLNTYRCPDIRKRVFWHGTYTEKDLDVKAELGVPLSEWEKIGLNYETKKIS